MPTQNDKDQLTRLEGFRQSIYEQYLTQARDAQLELIDALLLSPAIQSFPELSRSPIFRRQWHSVYAALERGRQDQAGMSHYLCQQVPVGTVNLYALDKSAWHHPRARTLEDLLYERSPAPTIEGHAIVKAHPYSFLSWVPQAGSSWALPVNSQRLTSDKSAVTLGVEQVQQLCEARKAVSERERTIVLGDGAYGNHRFLGGLKDHACTVIVRLRRNRVLYGPPPPYTGTGRPRKHGARFAFKAESTWPTPAAAMSFADPDWGQVRLRLWHDLHARQDVDTPFWVLLCEVHLERKKPPPPLWLAILNAQEALPVTLWRWYQFRWPIEPSLRFRKERLYWQVPHLQTAARCDRWTTLVDLAYWMLWLARELVQDQPLPWQKSQAQLSPGRVRQSLGALWARLHTRAAVPKRRGKSPGWRPGHPRSPPTRFAAVKRAPKTAPAG